MNITPSDWSGQYEDEDELFEALCALGLPQVIYAACDHAFHWLRNLRDSDPDVNLGRLRTQRCLANDAVLRRVKAGLRDRAGMTFLEVRGAGCEVLLVDSPECEIRFKKVDPLGRSSNIPTRRQRTMRGVAGQQYIGGCAPRPVITVGYVPDDELCELSWVSMKIEGGGSYRIAEPPADIIGAITRTIRANLGEESA